METPRSGELIMVTDIQLIARINFGRGLIGRDRALNGPEEEARFAGGLEEATRPLTKSNTADCGDERETLSLADGTDDPEELRSRIVPELFGGEGLAATKAAYAANALYLRDAKNFPQAYEITHKALHRMKEEDGGHGDCGASKSVESSVANVIPEHKFIEALGLFLPVDETVARLAQKNREHKQRNLEAGNYGLWSSSWHEDFLSQRVPQNFSHLAVDLSDHQTHGHHGLGVYAVGRDGQGFAKNEFIQQTGFEAFAVTLGKMRDLAHKLGENEEERLRILIGFYDDMLHVGAGLVVPGMPVFAEAA